ncbi:MAG: MFS transporter [Geminicoccaceae bacterium]|nr:MFS transporter [Geminicoccaceae bacterium]
MNRSIWLLSLAAFVAAATTRITDALLPQLAADFGVAISDAAAAITAFTFAYGVFQLAYGGIGARIGPFPTVIVACALSAIGTVACAVAPSLGWLTVGRFLSGMTGAAVIPMSMAYIGDTVAYEQRQPVIARFLMGQVTGVIVGQSFAGLFGELLDWQQLFLLLGVLWLLIAAALWRERASGRVPPHERPEVLVNPFFQYVRVLQIPWARVVLATVLIEGFVLFGAFPFVAAHLRFAFDLSYLTIGLVMSGFGVGGMVYIMGVSWLVRTLGEGGLVLGGGVIVALGFVAIASAGAWQIVAFATPVIGCGYYMLHNTLQTNATQMAPFDRSAAIALFAFGLFFGQAMGAAALGHLGEWTGYPAIFLGAGVALFVLAILFRLAARGRPQAR